MIIGYSSVRAYVHSLSASQNNYCGRLVNTLQTYTIDVEDIVSLLNLRKLQWESNLLPHLFLGTLKTTSSYIIYRSREQVCALHTMRDIATKRATSCDSFDYNIEPSNTSHGGVWLNRPFMLSVYGIAVATYTI